jgi:hypothetical protein
MTSPGMPLRTMASPEVSFGMMASAFETRTPLSMMIFSDVMLVYMSEALFAKMAEMVLPVLITPAVFKVATVGIIRIIRIIPIGGAGHLDILAVVSEIIIIFIDSRCIIKYFFGPFYGLLRFAIGLL